jgi:hypothetical protein
MYVLPGHPDDLDQKALGQPVLAHDASRHRPAIVREFEVAITLHHHEVVAFHASNRL